jgi:hypothetical protein
MKFGWRLQDIRSPPLRSRGLPAARQVNGRKCRQSGGVFKQAQSVALLVAKQEIGSKTEHRTLSVSSSAMASPGLILSPTFFTHAAMFPFQTMISV